MGIEYVDIIIGILNWDIKLGYITNVNQQCMIWVCHKIE